MKKYKVLSIIFVAIIISSCATVETTEIDTTSSDSSSGTTEATTITTSEETTAETTVETTQEIIEIPDAYIDLLNSFCDRSTKIGYPENYVWYANDIIIYEGYSDKWADDYGYALRDLDGDGSLELIIASTKPVTNQPFDDHPMQYHIVYDIFTLDENGKAVMILMQEQNCNLVLYDDNELLSFGACSMSERDYTRLSFTKQKNATVSNGTKYESLTYLNRLSEYYLWSDAIDDNTRRDYFWSIPNQEAHKEFNTYLSKLYDTNWVTPPPQTTDVFSLSSDESFVAWLCEKPFAELEVTSFADYEINRKD